MAFELFEPKTHYKGMQETMPFVCLWHKTEIMTFNKLAQTTFGIHKGVCCNLFFDKDTTTVGIKILTSKNEYGLEFRSPKSRKNPIVHLPIRKFITHYNLREFLTKKMRRPLIKNENGILCFSIKEVISGI